MFLAAESIRMFSPKHFTLACAALLTIVGGLDVAHADDTEVFFSDASASGNTKANILLILDTSGSMNHTAETETSAIPDPYTPGINYETDLGIDANCNYAKVYYWPVARGTQPTSCSDSNLKSFDRASYLKCKAANSGLDGAAGYYGGSDKFIRLNRNSGSNYTWNSSLDLGNNGRDVECFADNGVHGETTSSTSKYPKSSAGSSTSNSWVSGSANQWWSSSNVGTAYYLFSPNYITYNRNPPHTITRLSRMDVVKAAVANLLSSVANVNIGVMRYDAGSDTSAQGGMVVKTIQELDDTSKASILAAVTAFQPSGFTPLTETLFEAYRYLAGGTVKYGNTTKVCTAISNSDADENGNCISGGIVTSPSIAVSRTSGTLLGNTYKTPLSPSVCKANNHIIYLTDGLPTSDATANADIVSLTGQSCGTGDGQCLATLAKYMNEHDLAGNKTSVTTHFIGFGADVVSDAAKTYLEGAATAGGGKFYTADNITSLSTAFNEIVNLAVSDNSATFTAPSVAVNSFNRTQMLDSIYVGMFKPTKTKHWEGNLKKFKLKDLGTSGSPNIAIIGLEPVNTTAVDSTSGFFKDVAKDFWQISSAEGEDVTTKGGAARKLPDPDDTKRNLYTYIGTNTPGTAQALSGHPINTGNSAITDALLGTSAAGICGAGTDPCRATVINWARGYIDGDSSEVTNRQQMGDPVHSQPAVVIYANDSAATTTLAKVNDSLVFVATNDGYVHAIDVVSGVEKWAYVPQELLRDMKGLLLDDATTAKHYSLDGDIRVLRYDANNNGVVDVGTDRIILYVAQGRGGDRYYAIDVTEKANPKFLWSLGSAALGSKVSKSWSTPTLGRVKVGDGTAQNSQQLVLLFGGGHDDAEDSVPYLGSGDTYGNAVFMVDAVKGTVLWSQTKAASGAFANMTHAIPGNITAFDSNSDGYTDRMYVGDVAGQVWRFDITNGNAAAGTGDNALVAGGVIANLGAKQSGADVSIDNRSFYNAPDVAKFLASGSSSYYNIAIGSGDRVFPKSNTVTRDRFYSIRDYALQTRKQSYFDSLTAVVENDLTTIDGSTTTTFADGARGWKLSLTAKEKVLASSTTLNGIVLFTTFIPGTAANACTTTTGNARAYTIKADTAKKYFSDLYESFATTGLPSGVSVFNPSRLISSDTADANGDPVQAPNNGSGGICVSGVSILGRCVEYGSRVKTFWHEVGTN
jgi:type IV pilus assembly protein PilY1